MLLPTTLVGYKSEEELALDYAAAINEEICSVLAKLSGKTVILGVLDLSTPVVETPDVVAGRIRRALPFIEPQRLVIAPDCGLKYLPRDAAFGKMQAMVAGTAIVRSELASS